MFGGRPSIKDTIEAIGVPHTEIDLILVNGKSVGFDYNLVGGERVSVYPVFETLDISPIVRLRPKPLRNTRFVADVHLGTLARKLRLLGFDTLFENDYTGPHIIDLSLNEHRIILTKDRGTLKNTRVTHGYWIRSHTTHEQLKEVVSRLRLSNQLKPFTRCSRCNGLLYRIEKSQIIDCIPEKSYEYCHMFFKCSGCGQIYWKGTHYKRISKLVQELGHIQ